MTFLEPKDNLFFIGHAKTEGFFLDAFQKAKLHHAFLISGPKGIGKATFAYRIARFLLQKNIETSACNKLDISANDPVVRQISEGAHPNFLAIERDYIQTDKNKIIKAITKGDPLDDEALRELKKSAVIKVDEIRQINDFLSKKSFDGAWRVVLIDSVDELNPAAANALLKILEEPPAKTIILLIAHQVDKLLATIRSRCAKLMLTPLSESDVAVLLRRYAPNLQEKEVQTLAKISDGSIGRALNYAQNNGITMYEQLQSVIFAGTNFSLKEALRLAKLASSDENIWELAMELMLKIISELFEQSKKKDEIYALYTYITQTNQEVLHLNMDKTQAMICLFRHITKVVVDAH